MSEKDKEKKEISRSENKSTNMGHLWKPGESGNPGGRPKGLARLVRDSTKDGKLIVEQMVKILTGKTIKGAWGSPAYRDILDAAKWLADRGFGHSELTLDVNGDEYDLKRILLVELQKHDKSREVRNIPEGALEGQVVEAEQPLQHPDQERGDNKISD